MPRTLDTAIGRKEEGRRRSELGLRIGRIMTVFQVRG